MITDEQVNSVRKMLGYDMPKEEQEEVVDDDPVNHPSHYQTYSADNNIECIDAMKAAFGVEEVLDFCKLNAFKYLWRHSSKNGMEDIDKALWYISKYKELDIIELGD